MSTNCIHCGSGKRTGSDLLCDNCRCQNLLYTYGGPPGEDRHWPGCYEHHWDCRIAWLERKLAMMRADLWHYMQEEMQSKAAKRRLLAEANKSAIAESEERHGG